MSTDVHNFGPPVVEAVDVHHHYGEGPQRADVLFDINRQVREGELVIVTGPSGSGKTTLLTILGTSAARPRASCACLAPTLSASRAASSTCCATDPLPVPEAQSSVLLTALQNVMAGVSTTPLSDHNGTSRAPAICSACSASATRPRLARRAVGRQQQRVAIARVMIGLPDFIIADEPTSALDRVAGRLVVDQLKDLAMRAKCAVVLSTHDERIFDVASRRLHIEDGRCFDVPIHYH